MLKSVLRFLIPSGLLRLLHHYVLDCRPSAFARAGEGVQLLPPLYLAPDRVELGSFVRLQPFVRIIASSRQRVVIGSYTALTSGVTVVPGMHTPTVGVPQYLSPLGVNDRDRTLTIGEDVWVGAGAILLSAADIGRGALVGAGAVVTKPVPPYAVVAGVPARVVAVKFSLEQILEHERHLYPEAERTPRTLLEDLFQGPYKGLKVVGTSALTPQQSELIKAEALRLHLPLV